MIVIGVLVVFEDYGYLRDRMLTSTQFRGGSVFPPQEDTLCQIPSCASKLDVETRGE